MRLESRPFRRLRNCLRLPTIESQVQQTSQNWRSSRPGVYHVFHRLKRPRGQGGYAFRTVITLHNLCRSLSSAIRRIAANHSSVNRSPPVLRRVFVGAIRFWRIVAIVRPMRYYVSHRAFSDRCIHNIPNFVNLALQLI